MTTSKAKPDTNGTAEDSSPFAGASEPNPLLTNQAPPPRPQNVPDWEAEAKRLDSEARFWKTKYFEQLMHSSQVITALGQQFLTQEAMARMMGAGGPEAQAKIAAMLGGQG
jgi:hypothetical protein